MPTDAKPLFRTDALRNRLTAFTLPSSPSSKVRARAIRSTAPFSPMAGRKRSAVEQVLQYAVNLQIDWFLVTNMKEIRLFHKGHDLFTYERFETAGLATDDAALKRFVFLLGAERVVPPIGPTHLDNGDSLEETVRR
jgi:hypothetical protein